jgi:hypothetical protein
VFGAVFLASCFGESTGPEFRRGRFAVAPRFQSHHAASMVDFNRVRILIRRPGPGTTALDTVVFFPAGQSELQLILEVPIEGTSETFSMSLALINSAGDTVFRSGPDAITASSNALTPSSASPTLRYTGVGSDAAGVRFVGAPAAAFFQDTVILVAEAFDAGGAAIPGTPVAFELATPAVDSFRLRIPDAAEGRVVVREQRGNAGVRAALLTNQTAQHVIAVQPRPSSLQISGGNGQSGPAGLPLSQAVAARVLANDGLGVQGVEVTFTVTAGGGTLSQASDTSDAGGDVSVTWTLGESTGPQALIAAATGVAGASVSYGATATPGAATRLAFGVEPTSLVPGAQFAPEVEVLAQDQFGNLVTAFSGSVSLAIQNNPGGGSLTGTTTVAAVNGVATFTGVGMTGFGLGYTIQASATGMAGVTSQPFNMLVGPPAQLAFSVQPSSTTAGLPIAPPVQVLVQDAAGTTVPTATDAITLSLGANPGGGTLGGTVTVNAIGGVANFADLTVDRTGTGYTLEASGTGLSGATSSQFDIAAGAPQLLVVTSQPTASVAAGAPLTVVVEARDAQGNLVTGFAGQVTLELGANPGGALLGGTLSVTAAGGIATFSDPFLDRSGSGYTLVVNASGLTGATTTVFDVTPAAAQVLVFVSEPPATQTAGLPLAAVVEARDALGNVDTSFSGTVTLSLIANPTGDALQGVVTAAAEQGVAGFDAAFLRLAGAGYTLGASAPGLGGATSNAIEITPAAAVRLAFSAAPAPNQVAGAPIGFAVTAFDAFDNVATGFTGQVTAALGTNPTGATLSGTVTVTAASGVAVFTDPAINLAGSGYTLVASSGGLAATDPASVDVFPAAAEVLVITTQPPASVEAGALFSLLVEARDTLGNLVPAFTGEVTISIGSNPGGANLAGTATAPAVSGVASFTDLFLDRAATGYTLLASGAGLAPATSDPFGVTPAPAQSLVFTTGPGTAYQAGDPIPVAVSAFDQFGNVVTGFAGTITLDLGVNPGNGVLGGTTSVAATAGVATFNDNFVNRAAAGYALTATAPGLAAANSAGTFEITPAGATVLAFAVQPPGAVNPLAPFSVVVAAQDSFGNVNPDFTGTITLSLGSNPTGAVLGGTLTAGAAGGLATFADLTLDNFGLDYSLLAASAPLTSGTSDPIDVQPAAGQVAWINPLGGDWSDGSNWSNEAGPGVADTVLITQNGTYTVNVDVPVTVARITMGAGGGTQTLAVAEASLALTSPSTVGAGSVLLLDGGTLTLAGGTSDVSGQLDWRSGVLAGAGGILRVSGTAALTGGAKSLDAATLEISTAVASWTAGSLDVVNGSALHVNAGGVLTIAGDLDLTASAGTSFLRNFGAVNYGGGGGLRIGAQLQGDGSFTIAADTVRLLSSGAPEGSFALGAGSAFEVAASNSFGAILGAGDLRVSGGALVNVAGAALSGRSVVADGFLNITTGQLGSLFVLAGGSAGATFGPVQVTDSLVIDGGELSGGTFEVAAGGTLALASTGTATATGIILAGSGELSGTYSLNSGASILVASGGELTVTGAAPQLNASGAGFLQVQGTLDVVTSGTWLLGAQFSNLGTVNHSSGEWVLSGGGGGSTGSIALAGDVRLAFSGGDFDFLAASSLSGPGQVRFAPGLSTFTTAGDFSPRSAAVDGGTVTLNGPEEQLDSLTVRGGSLGGSAEVRVAQRFSWLGGQLSGTGTSDTLEVLPGAVMVIDTTGILGTHILAARVLSHRSAAGGGWTTGTVQSFTGGTIHNAAGAVLAMGNNARFNAGLDAGSFNNAGSIGVSTLGDGAHIATAFNNDGALSVASGFFATTGGGTSGGAFEVSVVGVMSVAGGHNFTAGSAVQGQGTVEFGGAGNLVEGAYNLDGGIGRTRVLSGRVDFTSAAADSTDILEMAGGVRGGSAVLVARQALAWDGGGFAGTGTTRALGDASLATMATRTLDGATVELEGTTVHTMGSVAISSGGVLRNVVEATYTLGDGTSVDSLAGTGNRFENFGALIVPAAPGSALITAQFITASPVDVQSGVLELAGGGSLDGTLQTAATTTLRISGGVMALQPTLAPASGLHLELAGGSLTLASGTVTIDSLTLSGGVVDGAGSLGANAVHWTGGGFAGTTGQVSALGNVHLPAGTRFLDGRTLQVNGDIHFQAGFIEMRNAGRIELQGDGHLYVEGTSAITDGPGDPGVLQTDGLVEVQGTAVFAINATWLPTQTVVIDQGRLRLEGSATLGMPLAFNTPEGVLEVAGQTGNEEVVIGSNFNPQFGEFGFNLRIESGIFVTNQDGPGVTIDSLEIAGGQFSTFDPADVRAFIWTGGVVAGFGAIRIASDGHGTIAGTAPLSLSEATLETHAALVYATTGGLSIEDGGRLRVDALGSLDLRSEAGVGSGTSGSLENDGLLIRSTSPNPIVIALPVFTQNTIDVVSGSLHLTGGGGAGAGMQVASGSTLRVEGSWLMTDSLRVLGDGTLEIANGTFALNTRRLEVENLSVASGGRVQSLNAIDSLIVHQNASWAGDYVAGDLSAGVLRLEGDFSHTGTGFAETGHVTWMERVGPQAVSFSDPTNARFGTLFLNRQGGLTGTDREISTSTGFGTLDSLLVVGNANLVAAASRIIAATRFSVPSNTAEVHVQTLEVGSFRVPDLNSGTDRIVMDSLIVRDSTNLGDGTAIAYGALRVAAGGVVQTDTSTALNLGAGIIVEGRLNIRSASSVNAPGSPLAIRAGGQATLEGPSPLLFVGLTTIEDGGTLEIRQGALQAGAVFVDGVLRLPGAASGATASMSVLATQGTGVVEQTNPTSTIAVTTVATFGGGASTLSGGTLLLQSENTSFAQTGTGGEFAAAATHLTRFEAGTAQTVSFADTVNSHFGAVTFTETIAALQTHVRAAGRIRVTDGSSVSGGTPAVRLLVDDTLEVDGEATLDQLLALDLKGAVVGETHAVSADTVVFAGSSQVMPGDEGPLLYSHVRITTPDSTINGADLFPQSLRVTAGQFRPQQGTLVGINDSLVVTGTGQIRMDVSEGELLVSGPVLWNTSVSGAGLLLDGLMVLEGPFRQESTGAPDNFQPSPGFVVRFSADNPQHVRFATPGISASRFSVLQTEFLTELILASDVVVAHDVQLFDASADVRDSTGTSNTLTVGGNIFVHAASAGNSLINTARVVLTGEGTLSLPTVIGAEVQFASSETVSLSDSLRVNSLRVSSGTLSLGGHTLTVTGNAAIDSVGALQMTLGSDSLDVGGDFTVSSSATSGALGQGFLVLRGGFSQLNSGEPANFVGSFDHRVVLAGSGPQTVAMQSPDSVAGSRFGELRNRNTSAPVTVDGTILALGMDLGGSGSNVTGANGRVVMGGLLSGSGGSLTTRYLALEQGLSLFGGSTIATDTTEWIGFGRLVNFGEEIQYHTVIINGTGNWTASTSDSITGDLTIRQGTFTTNNNTLLVGGRLRTEAGGGLETQFGLGDHVEVLGDAEFAGGTSSLSNDSLVIHGSLRQFNTDATNSFSASSGHTVRFAGPGPHVIEFENGNSSTFGDLTADPGATLTIAGYATVTGALSLQGGTTIDGPTGRLILAGLLTTATDIVRPGTVVLEGPPSLAGGVITLDPDTLELAGEWSPSLTDLRFGTIIGEPDAVVITAINAVNGSSVSLPNSAIIITGEGGQLAVGAASSLTARRVETRESGRLFIEEPDAAVTADTVLFAGGNSAMSEGTLTILGRLEQNGEGITFDAFGGSVRLEGTQRPVSVFFREPFSEGNRLHNLVVTGTNPVTLESDLVARSFVSIQATLAGAHALVSDSIEISGVGVTLSTRSLHLGGLDDPLRLLAGGQLDVDTLRLFGGDDVILPPATYRTISAVDGTSIFFAGSSAAATMQSIRLENSARFFVQDDQLLVTGDFEVLSGSELVMNVSGGLLQVDGNYLAAGGSSASGGLSAGTLRVGGNFTQGGGETDAFQAEVAHVTEFTDGVHQVSFANPGAGPSDSRFGTLRLAGASQAVELALQSPVRAGLLHDAAPGFPDRISATGGVTLGLDSMNVQNLTFSNVPVAIDVQAASTVSDVTFEDMNPLVTFLFVNMPQAVAINFASITFATTPASGGLYIVVSQLTGATSSLSLTGATPLDPDDLVLVQSGALLFWNGIQFPPP